MSGIFFIITVPEKKYEEEFKKKEKNSVVVIEKDKDGFKKPVKHCVKDNVDSKSYTNESYSVSEGENDTSRKSNRKSLGDVRLLYKSDSEIDKGEAIKHPIKDTVDITKSYKSEKRPEIDNDKSKKSSNCSSISEVRSLYRSCADANNYPKKPVNESLVKTPWGELKQAFKSKRSKLKINSGQGVNILSAFHWDTPLEIILTEILQRVNITNATWNTAMDKHFWQVTFMMESGNLCEELLQVLRTFGIGSKYKSSVCVIPCALYYKSDTKECDPSFERKSGMSNFSSSVRARNNLAQIIHAVRSEATLTFDWLFLLIVAGFVAAIGLVENSTVILVASMLISPLMSPITASTLGTAVRDRSLQLMGVAHELLGLFLCLVIGFIFGLVICAVDEHYGVGDWPTYEILSRCEIRSLWVGVLVAIPSGAAVALAILGEYTSSLVGVAISASLLPPAVNAGLLWAMSLVHLVYNDDETRWKGLVKSPVYSTHQPTELAVLGAISLCLTLVNIVCIYLTGVAVYKVKAVYPFERRNMSWWKDSRRKPHMRRYNNFDNWNTYSEWSSKNKSENLEEHHKNNIQDNTLPHRRKQFDRNTTKTANIQSYCINKTETDTDPEDSSTIEITSISPTRDYEKLDHSYVNHYVAQANDNINATKENNYDDEKNTYDDVYQDGSEKNESITSYDYHAIADSNKKLKKSTNFVVLDGRSFNV